MSENGPFRPDPKNPSQLVEDQYSWNKVANVIWLESPAGVGFSFSKNQSDYIGVGDARTANDTFAFLQTFFGQLFPQFRANNFYVTGESYGGHYVPTLALRVVEGNMRGEGVHINIKCASVDF
jgi:serine carboxypeptidase-like clade 2